MPSAGQCCISRVCVYVYVWAVNIWGVWAVLYNWCVDSLEYLVLGQCYTTSVGSVAHETQGKSCAPGVRVVLYNMCGRCFTERHC